MALVNIKESALSEKQLLAVDLLVGRTPTGSSMSKGEIADEVGVSRQTIYDWLKKPEFRKELVAQAKTVTDSGMAKGVTWMEQAMDDPSVKPAVKVQIVKLFMQSHGMLKDVQEQTVTESPVNIDKLMEAYGIKKKTE
mgnify:CR=1 FL=1